MTANNTTIETVSGKLVDLADPKPEDFIAEDIAWALSREPRFGGHTITELPYTVAQHSIQVAKLVDDALIVDSPMHEVAASYFRASPNKEHLEFFQDMTTGTLAQHVRLVKLALLHDASEAYLRDLPSPVKNLPGLKEAYMAVEKNVMDQILKEFKVEFTSQHYEKLSWNIIHWADLYARTIEAYHFMPSRGAFWGAEHKVPITLIDIQNFEMPHPSLEVYEEFLRALSSLNQ